VSLKQEEQPLLRHLGAGSLRATRPSAKGRVASYVNDPALDPKNRTLLAFAAYNAGPGGLHRFREKAKAMGLNPNIWFGNVENAASAIVGRETLQYVSNIYKYYIAYTVMRQMENNEKARKVIMHE
jgi:membrane-bound lytic murein transglycosylase MltF